MTWQRVPSFLHKNDYIVKHDMIIRSSRWGDDLIYVRASAERTTEFMPGPPEEEEIESVNRNRGGM